MLKNKFLYLFLSGVFLLSVCIIGSCIASTSVYNDINIIQNKILLLPYILSYSFITIGLLGLYEIFILIRKRYKEKK